MQPVAWRHAHWWAEGSLDWSQHPGQSVSSMESKVTWVWLRRMFKLEDITCRLSRRDGSPHGVLSQDTLRKRTPPRLSIQVCRGKWPGSQQHFDPINTAGHGTDDDNDDFILIAGSLTYVFLVTFITVYSINSWFSFKIEFICRVLQWSSLILFNPLILWRYGLTTASLWVKRHLIQNISQNQYHSTGLMTGCQFRNSNRELWSLACRHTSFDNMDKLVTKSNLAFRIQF